MLFRLKPGVGSHVEGRGQNLRKFKAGDLVESDRELDKKYPNKFERLPDIRPVVAPAPVAAPARELVAEKEVEAPDYMGTFPPEQKPKRGGAKSKKGKDVTDQFDQAADKDVRVVLKDDIYIAYDADRPTLQLDTFESAEALTEWLAGY